MKIIVERRERKNHHFFGMIVFAAFLVYLAFYTIGVELGKLF